MDLVAELFGLVGMLGIVSMLVLLGLLSRRIGQVTHMRAYYGGFFIGAVFVSVGILARLLHLDTATDLHNEVFWVLLYNGMPAIGVTIGVLVAWRYWSWLLAERGT